MEPTLHRADGTAHSSGSRCNEIVTVLRDTELHGLVHGMPAVARGGSHVCKALQEWLVSVIPRDQFELGPPWGHKPHDRGGASCAANCTVYSDLCAVTGRDGTGRVAPLGSSDNAHSQSQRRRFERGVS
jgi:hypothetical protein